jgi:hypothetical protein
MRLCQRCGGDIPDTMRRGTRFCRPACRVAHHAAQPVKAADTDVRLSPIEAGLLLDSAVPWFPNPPRHSGMAVLYNFERTLGLKRGPSWCEMADKARSIDREAGLREKKARKAAGRLIALGLARGGMRGRRMVIERTEAGTAVVERRHNELHATAEHVGEAVSGPEFMWWERKRSTRRLPGRWWPYIGDWYTELGDIFQVEVFRKEFTYGPLAGLVSREDQADVVRRCKAWHLDTMTPMTKASIRNWLHGDLLRILEAHRTAPDEDAVLP